MAATFVAYRVEEKTTTQITKLQSTNYEVTKAFTSSQLITWL